MCWSLQKQWNICSLFPCLCGDALALDNALLALNNFVYIIQQELWSNVFSSITCVLCQQQLLFGLAKCVINAVQRKDEATKAFGQALAPTVSGMKKMLRYVAALFALLWRLNHMAHNKLDANIVGWLQERHLNNGLANFDLHEIDSLANNI